MPNQIGFTIVFKCDEKGCNEIVNDFEGIKAHVLDHKLKKIKSVGY